MAFEKAKKKAELPKKKVPKVFVSDLPTPDALKKEKNAQGQREFIRYLKGEHINLRDAIKAHCYDCMGYYADGIMDCGCVRCPLHPFMPYNPNKPTLRKRKVKND